MTDNGKLDVLIALYLLPDLARHDFDSSTRLVDEYAVSTRGLALVVKDTTGMVTVKETGDHAVRNGSTRGARLGLIAGLFAWPFLLLTVTGGAVLGAAAGAVARRRLLSGIAGTMSDALPPSSAAIIAVYDHAEAETVTRVLTNSIQTAIAEIDHAAPDELKDGLQKAAASLGG